jgi:hypothetical protein
VIVRADDLVEVDLPPSERRRLVAAAAFTVPVEVAGAICAVRFADAEVAAAFARRYVDLEPTVVGHQVEAYAVADRELGALFWRWGGRVFRWPHGALPPDGLAFLADAVSISGFFDAHPNGALSLHAAAVEYEGGIAAIVGDSNVGKTTTALACARAGMTLYSDERCVIVDREVHPFPRALTIRATGRALLLADRDDDAFGHVLLAAPAGELRDVRFRTLFPGWETPPPLPLRSVFLLAGSAGRPEVTGTHGADAARVTLRYAHGAGRGFDRLTLLLRLFGKVACHRLLLGSPAASAAAIAETMRADALRPAPA